MSGNRLMPLAHPLGEQSEREAAGPSVVLDTFAGRVHVEWQPAAPVTALGQLPFFVEFLKHVRQLGGSLSPALYRVSTLSGLRYTVDLTSKREFSLACTNERF